ncbi:hypothetical protein H9L39_17033 [Fusarium oxysporum f. sp. albedinis]|nr:hypothetical protein H9L39_17033 [Fusarium oxysporum f. sp. albedinis]
MKALLNLGPTEDRPHKCTTDNKLDTLEVAPDVRTDRNLIMHVTSSRRCRSDWVELVGSKRRDVIPYTRCSNLRGGADDMV